MASASINRLSRMFRPNTAAAATEPQTPGMTRTTLLDEARDPSAARLTIRLSGVLLASFVVWAIFTPLHELTTSQGSILPEGFVQQVQHLEGGTVSEVLVDDGQFVGEGEPLVALDDLVIRAELAKAEARLQSLDLTAERLTAFVEERTARFDDTDGIGRIIDSQRAVEVTRTELRDAQLAIIGSEITGREAEIDGLIAQIEVVDQERALVAARADDYANAARRGAISRREAEAVMREKLKLDGELLRLKGQLNSARAGLGEARSRSSEVRAQLSTDALERLTEVETERVETAERVSQLRDQLRRSVIKAPVSGTVQAVAVRGPGEVVTPGEIVAEIVPDNETVFAQVEIPAESIGYVEPGMPAVVKVTTYDFARFGGVEGVVERISPSNRLTEDGRTVFDARIRMDSAVVGPESGGRTVRPGMTVIADIRTGRKSVMSFLLKPLRVLSDGALTER